jgi:hypothetical protein
MQLGDPPSSVAANLKLPSGLWRRQPCQVVVARSLAPHPALWAAATALGLMERALILRQAGDRLASQSHACPHRDPLATLQAHSSGEVARRLEATATSGRTTLGLCLAVFLDCVLLCFMPVSGLEADDVAYALQGMGREASYRKERLGKGTAGRALSAV